MALWDIAGKAAGVPVYKLLGGKTRDKVRIYNGGVRHGVNLVTPDDFAADIAKSVAAKEGFTIIKQSVGFHSAMPRDLPDFFYGEYVSAPAHYNKGALTEKGLKHVIACVEAMKAVVGDEVAITLDCGPGWVLTDAIRFAKALEPLNILWVEDLLSGDYSPYNLADVYRDLTMATSTPTHTGEQVYLRHNFKELIERQAVRVIGPDPEDIGGLAELKWVAEYADLHGILMAPHGIYDGLIGLAGLVQVCATMPQNYIAFEYPVGKPDWWYDIITGLPNPIVKDGLIEVWDTPGLGVDFDVEKARQYRPEGDENFFD
jgi:L-alanine-DL-glutamate epimerase-like enolase superfamily enzyme